MDYEQLREILVNTEKLYSLWQSTGMDEESFIRANKSLIEEYEKSRLAKERERQRQKRFFEKQKAQGKKSLTCLVSSETYDHLCRLRDKSIQAGEKKSLGQVVDDIILPGDNPAIVETQPEIPAPEPKTDRSIELMKELKAKGLKWRQIVEELNRQGLKPEKSDTWTESNARTAWFKYNKTNAK